MSIKFHRLAGAMLLCVLAASAQEAGRKGMHMYDPKSEVTIKGAVDEVKTSSGARPMMMGTHLIVKSENETREVMLGPSSYVTAQGFSFAKGDSIEVTGSKVSMGGTEQIIAREVIKNGKTLELRDKSGRPKWSGQMMRTNK